MRQRRSNPLYSPLGCGSALIVVLVLLISLLVVGPDLFSPGDLTAISSKDTTINDYVSHADLKRECQLCHDSWRGVSSRLCQECHILISTERETGAGLHGRLTDTGRCTDCHTDHIGAEANITLAKLDGFQHEVLTDFSLVLHSKGYAGEEISCSGCHSGERFRAELVECVECHLSGEPDFTVAHMASFGGDCIQCHDGRDSMSTFDHSLVFMIDGAHTSLSCDVCHFQEQEVDKSRDCVDCHTEPEIHFGLFGEDCGRCHSTAAWTPAQLREHQFPLDHGDSGKIACETCHVTSYVEYTCYGCHEHEQVSTIEDHASEDIFEIENCVACHPNGLEDDTEE